MGNDLLSTILAMSIIGGIVIIAVVVILRFVLGKTPWRWAVVLGILVVATMGVILLANPTSKNEFALTGNTLADLAPEKILPALEQATGVSSGELHMAPEGHLTLDRDFTASQSSTPFFYTQENITKSKSLQLSFQDNKGFVTAARVIPEVESQIYSLHAYFEAVTYLPVEAVIALCGRADRYMVTLADTRGKINPDRSVYYNRNGAKQSDSFHIRLDVQPLWQQEDGQYDGVGSDVIHLFYDGSETAQLPYGYYSLVDNGISHPGFLIRSNGRYQFDQYSEEPPTEGEYQIRDNTLYLIDGENRYTFTIDATTLVFQEDTSDPLPIPTPLTYTVDTGKNYVFALSQSDPLTGEPPAPFEKPTGPAVETLQDAIIQWVQSEVTATEISYRVLDEISDWQDDALGQTKYWTTYCLEVGLDGAIVPAYVSFDVSEDGYRLKKGTLCQAEEEKDAFLAKFFTGKARESFDLSIAQLIDQYTENSEESVKDALIIRGNETLQYIFDQFLQGGQSGPRADTMWGLACAIDIDIGGIQSPFVSTQASFDEWKDYVLRLWERNPDSYFAEHMPSGLVLIQCMEQQGLLPSLERAFAEPSLGLATEGPAS